MTSHASATRPRRRLVRSVLIGLAAAVVLAAVASTSLRSDWVRHQLALSFTRMPAGFTQLYFADQPVDVEQREATVRFSIDNQEGRTTRYAYRIAVTDHGKAVGVRTGSVQLAAGQTGAVSGSVTVRGSDWTDVTVSLTDRPETIRYLRTSS